MAPVLSESMKAVLYRMSVGETLCKSRAYKYGSIWIRESNGRAMRVNRATFDALVKRGLVEWVETDERDAKYNLTSLGKASVH